MSMLTFSPPLTQEALSAYQKASDAAPALAAMRVLLGGPYTVQAGGAKPLSEVDTTGLPGGFVIGISDLGGCGPMGAPGPGVAYWTGSEWRRSTRGVQATRPDTSTFTLDYWRDPTRIKLTGTQPPRVLLANPRVGHLVSIYRPGILAAVQAFSINLAGGVAGTDLTALGSAVNLFEVLDGSNLQAVQT